MTPVKITAPQAIFGNPITHPAHRADVVRLDKLLEVGGIYLDADVFVHRDFSDLLENSVVLGKRHICNAVILAEPGAPFLERWHAEYRSFRSTGRDANWNEHSVRSPLDWPVEFWEEITVLPPTAFFSASWQPAGIARLFTSTEELVTDAVYANHLWDTYAWDGYLRGLTAGRVRRLERNFHRWCGPYLRDLPDDFGAPAHVSPNGAASCTIVTTCKGRLSFLQRTLPQMISTGCPVVVVDFDCPDSTADFVRRHFPGVAVVKLNDRPVFNLSAARNAGAAVATGSTIAFIDCDIELSVHFAEFLHALDLDPEEFLTGDLSGPQLIGQCLVPRRPFEKIGGYDEAMTGWGYEDDDERVEKAGAKRRTLSPGIMTAIPHGDDLHVAATTREGNKWATHRINSVYSHNKRDIEGASRPLTLVERRELRQLVENVISRLRTQGGSLTFSLSLKQLSMAATTDKIREGAYRLDCSLEYTLTLGS